jgi:hypothetical protein
MPDATREHRSFAAEIKFLVTPEQADVIRDWARSRLTPDPYGSGEGGDRYSTTTLYCDTPEQDVFQRRGSYGRSKYRIRRYATSDMVFLERKLRTKDMLSKRRSLVPIDYLSLLASKPDTWPDDWLGTWFVDRLAARRLAPVCQVMYDRSARLAATPYGVARLTIDNDLRAWPAAGFEFQGGDPAPVLPGRAIVEMKYRVEMPAVFKALVEQFRLNPTRISKYRSAMTALGLAADPAVEQPRSCQTS